MTASKKPWPPSRDEKPYREVVDLIHGTIPLPHPIDLLVDTPEFQRLRRIKQLGTAFSVFPNCDHSRFVHSLGVYHLARLFVHVIAKRSSSVTITQRDELCVSIAGLCHDLGHGPLSHVFDGPFMLAANPDAKWRHERGSVLMFDRVCKYDFVQKALLEYLDEDDFIFIKELIDPPIERFTEEGQWNYRGRPLEKSFLYDIVSNSIDSVDVDKFDYLLRDSHHAAIAIPFNQNSVMRLMDWMRPLDVIEQLPNGRALKYSRICFAVKVIDDVDSVGQSRYMLHEKLYSHHTVRAYEYMVLQALISADHYLHFEGDDRRRYQLSRTYENLGAFLKTDDSIIQMVENSSLDELKSASRILRDLSFRILPKLIGTVMMRNSNNCTQDKVKHRIYELADSNIVSEEDFIICIRSMHRGMGVEKHPMNEVFFYDHKAHAQQLEPYRIDQALLKHKSSLFGGSQSIMIYVSATTKAKSNAAQIIAELLAAFEKFMREESHEHLVKNSCLLTDNVQHSV
uniref:HD/PDEase domain-containing protein n=1 Tax=Parascaris univalens TaxID=6257 RepID=A0A914ZZC2_PARUN